ncbi:MAG: hypothetical protein ACLRMJ_01600 [Alistipes finegoldii]
MDMTADIGAGGSARPLASDGVQWTAWAMSTNARRLRSNRILVRGAGPAVESRHMESSGSAWTTRRLCLTPIYSAQEVPACLSEQNSSMLEYSPTAAFTALQPGD